MHGSRHLRHRNRPGAFEGRPSRLYDLIARRLLRPVYRRLAADIAAGVPAGAAVLDIGTGPGVLLRELGCRRPDLRLTGVDLSADMVTAAQRNLRTAGVDATTLVGDVTDLPVADQSYDVIVSSFSLHHWDEPAAAAPQLARVLRSGGRLCVYDFRFAPFDLLAAALQEQPGFAGQQPRRSRFRTGVPLLPRCVRWELPAQQPSSQ